jgi:hypothetical protein
MERPPTQSPAQKRGSWQRRFVGAFFVTAIPIFMYFHFIGPAYSLSDSMLIAVAAGSFPGFLAALFGRRVLDFLLEFPW